VDISGDVVYLLAERFAIVEQSLLELLGYFTVVVFSGFPGGIQEQAQRFVQLEKRHRFRKIPRG
jgi:hypothetical protein